MKNILFLIILNMFSTQVLAGAQANQCYKKFISIQENDGELNYFFSRADRTFDNSFKIFWASNPLKKSSKKGFLFLGKNNAWFWPHYLTRKSKEKFRYHLKLGSYEYLVEGAQRGLIKPRIKISQKNKNLNINEKVPSIALKKLFNKKRDWLTQWPYVLKAMIRNMRSKIPNNKKLKQLEIEQNKFISNFEKSFKKSERKIQAEIDTLEISKNELDQKITNWHNDWRLKNTQLDGTKISREPLFYLRTLKYQKVELENSSLEASLRLGELRFDNKKVWETHRAIDSFWESTKGLSKTREIEQRILNWKTDKIKKMALQNFVDTYLSKKFMIREQRFRHDRLKKSSYVAHFAKLNNVVLEQNECKFLHKSGLAQKSLKKILKRRQKREIASQKK